MSLCVTGRGLTVRSLRSRTPSAKPYDQAGYSRIACCIDTTYGAHSVRVQQDSTWPASQHTHVHAPATTHTCISCLLKVA